ncbi:acyltransferase [Pseudomonas koreensis]|uniref:acyltransferase family protein n=1 Tax=Pseudomonas koreensis TaxID=198620 RepID=UPI0021C69C8F|nr:acyltransferase [Pseudomonas koreensis]MCU0075002.1 acyltransferase [Pseudomonas koreensis]
MSATEPTKGIHYPNFDWLRLLLAIQVVAIHTGVGSNVFMNPVPAFLAISGFVVLGSIERRPIGHFFISRALRVLPLLAVSFVAVGIYFSPEEMYRNILFWLWPTGTPPANPVVWTLIYEETFYALLAILFSLGVYRKKIVPIAICAVIMGLSISFKLIALPPPWYMLGSAFFLGNVVYQSRDLIIKYVNKWVATGLLIASIVAVYNLPYQSTFRYPDTYIDFLAFLAMLIFAIAGPQLPRLKVDMSYSIYLLHCLVLAQINYFVPMGNRIFWFTLLTTLPISYAAWYIIEKPALDLKNKILQKKVPVGKLEQA